MIRRPPRATRIDTLFPYTTLFRAGDIPKLQVAFPKAVETTCRDPGQIERGRSDAAHARYFGRDRVQNALERGHVAKAPEGNGGGDRGNGEGGRSRHTPAEGLKPGALALRPEEQRGGGECVRTSRNP